MDFGLYYYNARWYDSYLNHFTQPDSIVPEQTQGVQAWDRYAYSNNNPILYTDPSGHSIQPPPCWLCNMTFSYASSSGVFAPDGPINGLLDLVLPGLVNLYPGGGDVNTSEDLITFSGAEDYYPAMASNVVMIGADVVPNSAMGYGGQFLDPDDEIVIFKQPGTETFKAYDPMGNSAQSLSVAGSPEEALSAAFNRPPASGEPYWTTTAGQIGATGRYPYLDGQGSPGHVSIYGGAPNTNASPVGITRFGDKFKVDIEFLKIWVKHLFE